MAKRKAKRLVRRWAGSLTYKSVTELLRLLDGIRGYDQIDVVLGDFKIGLRRDGSKGASTAPVRLSDDRAPVHMPPSDKAQLGAGHVAIGSASASEGRIVTAPMLGTFYRAPKPGASAFVKPGDTVKIGDTIGVIEVMKLFTSVTSDASGVVVEFLVENGNLVEYGQPLLRISPSVDPTKSS